MSMQFQPPQMTRVSAPDSGPAVGLRLALGMLMEESLGHGYRFCALHIRVAIAELDEIIGDKPVVAQRKRGR